MSSPQLLSELKHIVEEETGILLLDSETELLGELLINSYDILLKNEQFGKEES